MVVSLGPFQRIVDVYFPDEGAASDGSISYIFISAGSFIFDQGVKASSGPTSLWNYYRAPDGTETISYYGPATQTADASPLFTPVNSDPTKNLIDNPAFSIYGDQEKSYNGNVETHSVYLNDYNTGIVTFAANVSVDWDTARWLDESGVALKAKGWRFYKNNTPSPGSVYHLETQLA